MYPPVNKKIIHHAKLTFVADDRKLKILDPIQIENYLLTES